MTAASKGVEIILPTDVVVADAFSADANTQVLMVHVPMVESNLYSIHVYDTMA